MWPGCTQVNAVEGGNRAVLGGWPITPESRHRCSGVYGVKAGVLIYDILLEVHITLGHVEVVMADCD